MDVTNNQTEIMGVIKDEFVFNHEIYAEKFYTFTIEVPRLSGTYDDIKVMISERLIMDGEYQPGDTVVVSGQFRSYNSNDVGSNKLVLTVFAKDIMHCEGEIKNPNRLYLNGYICKSPVYRTTPFGREITDLLLAVNRSYNKSDYIPVIAWGRNARYAKNLAVGENVRIWGRIQSRNYQKRMNEEEVITKTAYEVSINRLELITSDSDNNDIGIGDSVFDHHEFLEVEPEVEE
jgi:single-stranded DNA-binding protein